MFLCTGINLHSFCVIGGDSWLFSGNCVYWLVLVANKQTNKQATQLWYFLWDQVLVQSWYFSTKMVVLEWEYLGCTVVVLHIISVSISSRWWYRTCSFYWPVTSPFSTHCLSKTWNTLWPVDKFGQKDESLIECMCNTTCRNMVHFTKTLLFVAEKKYAVVKACWFMLIFCNLLNIKDLWCRAVLGIKWCGCLDNINYVSILYL